MDRKSGLTREELKLAITNESQRFEEFYFWLEQHMPPSFFEEIDHEDLLLITHNLMSFNLQEFFSLMHQKNSAIVLCLDSPTVDLKILKNFGMQGIRYYRTFISNEPPPFPELTSNLRIGIVYFTKAQEKTEQVLTEKRKQELLELVKTRSPDFTEEDFNSLISGMDSRFLRSMTTERLITALNMFFRAKTRDHCQYEVSYNENWQEKNKPSMQIVLAWKNVPRYHFLYRLSQTIYRHKLDMQHVVATYVAPFSTESILIMSIALHGASGKAAWDEADIPDFLRELATLKYFDAFDLIEKTFVTPDLLSGNMANFLRSTINFVHQCLVHDDPNLYSIANIEEGICRHPELTQKLCEAFEWKFHPETHNLEKFYEEKNHFLSLVEALDTGHEINDLRRKNILRQAMNFIEHTLKTNFYRTNKTALSFRIDPEYLNHVPYERKDIFPELPYGIFYIKGMQFIGFHIRFKDLSRGGLRTVAPERLEQLIAERNHVFLECYNLSYTQQKKNKDIPEGGSKAVILLEPFDKTTHEIDIFKKELKIAKMPSEEIEQHVKSFRKKHKIEFLHQAQRSFVNSFLTIINCEDNGQLKAKHIVDYWKRPEYIYLGPDENMHNEVIEWIAQHSEKHGYKPGKSFITSKPSLGINHKEFGVTSLGVNVYMEQVLLFLGIDPSKDIFTVKISGGPDGDVAGNQLHNLYTHYPKTAKLLALTDISGTIYDPEGLDLEEMEKLFQSGLSIREYPAEKLHEDGFLLDLRSKKEQTAYITQTLCWRKREGKLYKDWLSGNEMQHLFRNNVHQVKTDIFIPAGGRPRTLNSSNYRDFLDENNNPTSKAIVEGANLYLTQEARRALEKLGVLIVKDSSCNKGGVICSSFEVLSCLVLPEEDFLKEKTQLVDQILEIIKKTALNEARILLHTHQKTGEYLTDISEWVSEKINCYKYQLLEYLESVKLSDSFKDPLIRCLFQYCPEIIRSSYTKELLANVPDIHKKAIIACYIASNLVYNRGLSWSPSIIDVLPLIAQDPNIIGPSKRK
ncbi:MAG: NAD-glutamate dehydrogenase [Chlamydiota bacterium]|jgi:glutamate dehydrogenase